MHVGPKASPGWQACCSPPDMAWVNDVYQKTEKRFSKRGRVVWVGKSRSSSSRRWQVTRGLTLPNSACVYKQLVGHAQKSNRVMSTCMLLNTGGAKRPLDLVACCIEGLPCMGVLLCVPSWITPMMNASLYYSGCMLILRHIRSRRPKMVGRT